MNRVNQAVHNNAVWCHAVTQAHGIPGEFTEAFWSNSKVVPMYYPNLVTTLGKTGITAQLKQIEHFQKTPPKPYWAIKDSYGCLELESMGFQLLFGASWIYRDPHKKLPAVNKKLEVRKVETSEALYQWETAWSQGGSPASEAQRTFQPGLLQDPNIAIMAGFLEDELVCGLIANRSGEVVGVSNHFNSEKVPEPYVCLGAIMKQFPGIPIVGYEEGEDLVALKPLDFETIGELKVWMTVS